MDNVITGYDVSKKGSKDMSCISYTCGKCKTLIDCELYDLSHEWNQEDKEKYLDKNKTEYKSCPSCKTEFSCEVIMR